jgi:predicted neuraminidase
MAERVTPTSFIYTSAPYPSAHASTIVETTQGILLAAWFGGTAEGRPDVGIYLTRKVRKEWQEPFQVAMGYGPEGQRLPCYNPVLFQPKGGPLMLFYKVGHSPQSWWAYLLLSTDEGLTWSTPKRLPEGFLGPIKNKPVEFGNSIILCPSSTEEHGWQVHFESTTDFGESWSKTLPVNDPSVIGAIQPSILRKNSGIKAVGRTQQGHLFAIDSTDGRTWGPMRLLETKNPNSGIDAVTLHDGRHVLVYNDSSKERTPLCVAVSSDGDRWTKFLTLESDTGEFSYPAVIQARNGEIHIIYTWNRKAIKYAHLQLSQLPTNR